MLNQLTINGHEYVNVPADRDTLLSLGLPEDQVDDVINNSLIEDAKLEVREQVRRDIHANAGDTQSLLGTTADGTQLALYMIAELIDAIHTSTTLDELKAKLEPRLAVAQTHLQSVASGETVPTFVVKGVDSVVSDIQTRATSVSAILTEAVVK